MAYTPVLWLAAFHKSILRADCGKSAEENSFQHSVAIQLFCNEIGEVVQADSILMSGPAVNASGILQRIVHNHPFCHHDGPGLIATCMPVGVEVIKSHA